MIVWVFFIGGSGGDGLANLLEQSSNAVTIDGEKKWRIHRYVDYKVKFWAPTLQNTPERINRVTQLNKQQLEIANSNNQYLIITSHDYQMKDTFLKNTIDEKKHVKVLLTFDINETQRNFRLKHLIEFNQSEMLQSSAINKKNFQTEPNFIIDIKEILNSWEYTKQFTETIGLHLEYKDFEYYKKLVLGEIFDRTPGIEYYKSYVDADNKIHYAKIV